MLKLSEIRHVQIELTTRCNARCPMCMRNYRGMEYNSGYPVIELSLADIKKILPVEMLQQIQQQPPATGGFRPRQNPWQGIEFNGNLGDFALAQEALEIVHYLTEHDVQVHINTNGSLRTPDWWARLASPLVTVGFALDGLADTHHLYRQDTDWHRIIKNAQGLIAAGGRATWRFIPFDHNRHQEDACRQLAQELRFERFENIHGGRDRGPAYDRDGNFSHWIGDRWPSESSEPQPITPLLQNHITWYDSKKVTHSRDTVDLNIQCVHKRNREIYIAADGTVYPCCFLGFYPKQMHHPGNQELAPMITENNALEYSLEHCLQWFDKVEASWNQSSIADGRTYQCVTTCNQNQKTL